MKLAQFWYFGHVSKSLVAKSTTAMNPNPGPRLLCGESAPFPYRILTYALYFDSKLRLTELRP